MISLPFFTIGQNFNKNSGELGLGVLRRTKRQNQEPPLEPIPLCPLLAPVQVFPVKNSLIRSIRAIQSSGQKALTKFLMEGWYWWESASSAISCIYTGIGYEMFCELFCRTLQNINFQKLHLRFFTSKTGLYFFRRKKNLG